MGISSEPYLLIFISEGRGNIYWEFIVETKISAKRFTVCRRISFLNWRDVFSICLTYHFARKCLANVGNLVPSRKSISTQFSYVEIRIKRGESKK